jgi:hypothetical protein
MSGTFRPNQIDPPVRAPLLDQTTGAPSATWRQWFGGIARFLARMSDVTIDYDPPSIPANSTASVSFGLQGARPGDTLTATFSPGNAGVVVGADIIAADQVLVRFTNLTGGAIDLAAGTIFIAWRRRQ